jgi:glycosyltransferase involved in cell wall biosynthesis
MRLEYSRSTSDRPDREDKPSVRSPDGTNGVAPWPRISVVIPAMNEAENLPHVFASLPADIHEIVLVDGNSTDGTVEVARELFPAVRIVGQSRRGKGNALTCGFAACRGDIIVMLDADGSADPQEIPRFVAALRDGADFAKGSRFLEGGGSEDITAMRRMGNATLGGLVNLLFGTRYTDLCYGYNAFWARCLADLSVDCDGFEVETLIKLRAARAGLAVVEVPSYEKNRIYGESHLNAVRDGMRVLRTIIRERFRRQNGVPAQAAASSLMGS